MRNLLKETYLLDYNSTNIQTLVDKNKWIEMDQHDKIKSIYNYVKDDIKFGYNQSDYRKASDILRDGYGQCNTKSILFMALLRASGVKCRIHGFTIYKKLQKGAISGIWYKLAPKEIIHSWVEIKYNDEWLNIEGFILDDSYLTALQSKFSNASGFFEGYGVSTDNFKSPEVNWCGNNTYIQKEGIAQDYGVFDQPDDFFSKYYQMLNPIKKFIYVYITRHQMNRKVSKMRNNQKR